MKKKPSILLNPYFTLRNILLLYCAFLVYSSSGAGTANTTLVVVPEKTCYIDTPQYAVTDYDFLIDDFEQELEDSNDNDDDSYHGVYNYIEEKPSIKSCISVHLKHSFVKRIKTHSLIPLYILYKQFKIAFC